MTDLAASAVPDTDWSVGDPASAVASCPDEGFRQAVAVARGAFRDGLHGVIALSPQETEDILARFDQSVMEIAAAMISHQVLARSVRAAPRERPLRLIRGV